MKRNVARLFYERRNRFGFRHFDVVMYSENFSNKEFVGSKKKQSNWWGQKLFIFNVRKNPLFFIRPFFISKRNWLRVVSQGFADSCFEGLSKIVAYLFYASCFLKFRSLLMDFCCLRQRLWKVGNVQCKVLSIVRFKFLRVKGRERGQLFHSV